jgi:DNA-directed RNA polymerase subunit RPC12/RpoP
MNEVARDQSTQTDSVRIVSISWLNTGDTVEVADIYLCFNCGEPHPPVASLRQGEAAPSCTNCGSHGRWVRA